jgi:hypothetical protein
MVHAYPDGISALLRVDAFMSVLLASTVLLVPNRLTVAVDGHEFGEHIKLVTSSVPSLHVNTIVPV